MRMRNTTVQGHFSYRNQAQGLWFDTDNQNITINNATLSENLLASLQLEANEGPITLENSHLCSSGLGVKLIDRKKVSIWGNTFYNNSGTNIQQAEIYVAGKSGGRYVTDWLTHEATSFTRRERASGTIHLKMPNGTKCVWNLSCRG